MSAEKFKRKLAAILSADVKGYSRLMGEDEKGTIRTLNAYQEVMTEFIQQHRSRLVGGGRGATCWRGVRVVLERRSASQPSSSTH